MRTLPLLAALAVSVSPAHAATHDRAWQVGNDSMHIYNNDLNMNSAADRATMLARVERATTRLCRDRADARACAADTLAQTLSGPRAAPLRLAVVERNAVVLAAR